MRFKRLADWLAWQETLNPRAIALGLERPLEVATRLGLESAPPGVSVITVAGTNGKGSCVAMLEAVLREAGVKAGVYSSPHLLRFNETVRVNSQPLSDEALIDAFAAVDAARGGGAGEPVALTAFEYRSLAAMQCFKARELPVWVLEVGLGGRLDAVNILDPDLALVTNIGLDHEDWLGAGRDNIGREKAGILRSQRPGICGDLDPPRGFLDAARALGAELYQLGRDFRAEPSAGDVRGLHGTPSPRHWDFDGPNGRLTALPHPGLRGQCQLNNAACVLMAVSMIPYVFGLDPGQLPEAAVRRALPGARLPGRQQLIPGPVETVIDVAHNPAAAVELARTLTDAQTPGQTYAIFGALRDKDVRGMFWALEPVVDGWSTVDTFGPRGMAGGRLAQMLESAGAPHPVAAFPDVAAAYHAVRGHAAPGDRIVLMGSFATAREAIMLDILEVSSDT